MATKTIATLKFAIQVGKRRIEFTPNTPITATQRRALRDRHYTDGWVKEVDGSKTPHIIRRAAGRLAYHNLVGTDASQDLEYLVCQAAADLNGVEGSRAKGQGQRSYLNAMFNKVRKEFAGQFDEIIIEGADDPSAEVEGASLLIAHSSEVAFAAREFIFNLLK